MNEKDTVKISVFGDFAPVQRFNDYRFKESLFCDGLKETISSSDLSVVNVEAPLTNRGVPIHKTGPNLRADPLFAETLRAAGVDVAGLANNHIRDFGDEGVIDTIDVCREAGLDVVGAGRNLEEATRVLFKEIKGVKISIIAVAEREFSIASSVSAGAAPLDVIEVARTLRRCQQSTDICIVLLHGGNEYFPLPRPKLREAARFFVESGASAVICSHTHLPSAFEWYEGAFISYGLGNLIFDHLNPPEGWNEGYGVELSISHNKRALQDAVVVPYQQGYSLKGARRLGREEQENFMTRLKEENNNLLDCYRYNLAWRSFCEGRSRYLMANFLTPLSFRGLSRLWRIRVFRRIFQGDLAKKMARQNLIQCPSHREVIEFCLDEETKGN